LHVRNFFILQNWNFVFSYWMYKSLYLLDTYSLSVMWIANYFYYEPFHLTMLILSFNTLRSQNYKIFFLCSSRLWSVI
jgi:hypothetical protein